MSDAKLGGLLGSGKEAEAFAFGDRVVKLYRATAPKRSAFREAAILALVETFGLPTPEVSGVRQIDGRWGVVMARVEGVTFAEAMSRQPHLTLSLLKRMASLQRHAHRHPGTQLASLKARLTANIRRTKTLGQTRQNLLLDRLTALPDGDRLCHGDFHPMNIIGPLGAEVVVDWLDAACGDPAADVCRSCVLMTPAHPELASAYLEAYSAIGGESKERILAWRPIVAAARLAEGVSAEADQLMEMVDAS